MEHTVREVCSHKTLIKHLVRPRQEGPQCDGCLCWQHRTCETSISQSDYCKAVRTGASIDWQCSICDIPQAQSTPILFSETSATDLHAPSDADFTDPDQSVEDEPVPYQSQHINYQAIDESSLLSLPLLKMLPQAPLHSTHVFSVMECAGGVYQIGSNTHNHPAEVGAALTARITEKVKALFLALANIFKPASVIVEDMLLEDLQDISSPRYPS
ncbi:hypothetical protein ACROYT_G014826 [Oculina patagonica]